MPCRVHPTEREKERDRLNREAARLHKWLESKMEVPDLDDTGRLCALIRALGNMGFTNVCVENINDKEARELLGWWERHQDYDAKYGRR